MFAVLFFFAAWWMPVIVQAEVEWNALSTLNLDKRPTGVFTTIDNKLAYILIPGEIQVYSLATKTLRGRIPVDKDISKLSVSPQGDQFFLIIYEWANRLHSRPGRVQGSDQ